MKKQFANSLDLRATWRALDADKAAPEEFAILARSASALGEPLLAYDIARRGLERHPRHLPLLQVAALAQARSGSPLRATRILEPELQDGHGDEDTYGILARAYKDLWERCEDGEQRRRYGERSVELYRKGHEATGGHYTGLNAAAMLLLLDRAAEARVLAAKVAHLCREALQARPEDYWLQASFAEASLILGETAQAVVAYRAALAVPDIGPVEIASTRRQALRIAGVLGATKQVAGLFQLPAVVVCTGHMIDAPGREKPRFPAELEQEVRRRMDRELDRLNAGFGYVSAACGTDIVFIEAMLERGAEVHVVMPFEREDFIAQSVRFAGEHWVVRCRRALERAASVHYATAEKFLGDEVLFDHCNRVMEGLGVMRARALDTKPRLLAVVDGSEDVGRGGGAAAFATEWEAKHGEVLRLDPGEMLAKKNRALKKTAGKGAEEARPRKTYTRSIHTMLFADIVGFSKLQEEQSPLFVEEYLSRVAALLRRTASKPCFANTWGDGLFFVFSEVADGARMALELRDTLAGVDWAACGLPPTLNLRISLHVGPVFPAEDPILGRTNYYGTHVARAARIEPITTPGCVYATEQVAAMLSLDHASGLRTEYVGQIALAKHYGTFSIYQVRRDGEVE